MSPRWVVEAMREEHLDQVMAIEEVSFTTPWPREAFLADLEGSPWAHPRVLLDAERLGSGVRGYVCFWLLQGEITIHNIAVHPEDRRRGAASRLLEEAFTEGERSGCRWAYLEVRPSNLAALSLYGRWGFVPVARRRGYYEDTGEDALVMRAPVSRASVERARKRVIG